MSVVIKTVFDGNIHKFSLTQPSYDELEQAVNSIYGKRGFSFRYQDEDGDLVTISSSLELQEALRVTQNKGLKLILSSKDNKDDFVCVDSPVRVHQRAKQQAKEAKEPPKEPKDDAPEKSKAQQETPKLLPSRPKSPQNPRRRRASRTGKRIARRRGWRCANC